MNDNRPPLVPIFGMRCRTQSYTFKNPNAGTRQFLHFQAYRDGAGDSWTIQRVNQVQERNGNAYADVETMDLRLPFAEMLRALASYDSYYNRSTASFTPSYPDAAALGFEHYRAFAEREGFVFDTQGMPWPRPAAGVLPPTDAHARFDEKDIARADKHLQRPPEEFGPAPPSRKLPDALFLFDAFNRRAIGKNADHEIAGMRALSLMDQFVNHIDAMNGHLSVYAAHHKGLDAPGRLASAEISLNTARVQLRQLKAYGVDTAAFEKFANECGVTVQVMAAQGLYDQLARVPHPFSDAEAKFKERVGKALDLYAELERTLADKHTAAAYAEGRTALHEMMIQGGAPALPPAIAQFVTRYRQQRAEYIKDAKPPAAPKPPAGP